MKQTELALLTDEALAQEAKKRKTQSTYFAFAFGVILGIAIYSTVKNGFGLLTFLPVLLFPAAIRTRKGYGEVKEEIQSRNASYPGTQS